MEKVKIVKLYNIKRLKGNFVSVLHEHSNHLQDLCDKMGLELITLSHFYFPKKSIFDYRCNYKVEPNLFEKYLEYKNSKLVCNLPIALFKKEVIAKYENIMEDYGFINGKKLTAKAHLLLRILENNKKGVKEFYIEDLL
ncbi:MAG: hypothetical protein WC376_00300 [Candidatus Nanoarchaeia archaeon]